MLEFRALEVRGRSGNGRPAQPQGHSCRPQIKQREHYVQHCWKAGTILSELKIGRDFAVIQSNGCRRVGPESQAIPRTSHGKAARLRWKKIKGRIGGPGSVRGK